ncbi:MAG: HEPN domain-containing protein [Bacteroidetes bacterium]|nr:HEPN domain-containing protein [Bacteroidota bacterium]
MSGPEKFEEWYFQSDYDFETAEAMFSSGRYIYTIFMCHLSLEKALKGLFNKRTKEHPVKSHNLMYFIDKMALEMNEDNMVFLFELNKVSIPTRYPYDLEKLMSYYSKEITLKILNRTKSIQQWIRQQ